jgi:MerR family transcriptional regulator, copper efflux regulator
MMSYFLFHGLGIQPPHFQIDAHSVHYEVCSNVKSCEEIMMLISELAQKTGLTSHTIRFYEKQGLLAKRYIRRSANNYRHYSEEAIERIAVIKTLRAAGFTLAEIKNLMGKWDAGTLTPREGLNFLQQKMDEIDAKIEELKQIKVALMSTLGAHIKQATEIETRT